MFTRLMVGAALCALVLHPLAQVQAPSTSARPVLELEKARFALSEQVFFWVGVTAPRADLIPRSLWNTCRVIVTRPDGTQKTDVVNWPMDGMVDRGWRGGWGLGSEPPHVGRYVVVFEFAGQRTAPVSFVVEDIPMVNDITAEFVFPSPLALGSADAMVTFTVRNGSSQTIRFPYRGVMSGDVWIWLDKTSGDRWSSRFFAPQALLLRAGGIERSLIGEDRFTWSLATRVPTVTLAPGAPASSPSRGRPDSGDVDRRKAARHAKC